MPDAYVPGTIRVTWPDGSYDDLLPDTRATAVVLSRTGELEACKVEFTKGHHFVSFTDAVGDVLRLRVSSIAHRRGVASAVEVPGSAGLRWRNGRIESTEDTLARAENAWKEERNHLCRLLIVLKEQKASIERLQKDAEGR